VTIEVEIAMRFTFNSGNGHFVSGGSAFANTENDSELSTLRDEILLADLSQRHSQSTTRSIGPTSVWTRATRFDGNPYVQPFDDNSERPSADDTITTAK